MEQERTKDRNRVKIGEKIKKNERKEYTGAERKATNIMETRK